MPQTAPRAIVALCPVEDDLSASIREALEAAEWRTHVPAGSDICLKVNLGWDLFIPGSITSPLFVETLIQVMRDHVGKIYMVESDQVLEDIELAFRNSGMAGVCERNGVEWVNMGRAETVPVDAPDNKVLQRIDVPKILRDTVFITVPVMKTHAKTGITGALKNQWGCLSKMRHEYHLVLDDALADLNAVMRPALAIMDGTVGLEGNGPKSGSPRIANRVLCSADPVALDTIQAIHMGIDPATVGHLRTCAERGIGTNDPDQIEVRGLDPVDSRVVFRPATHNAVSLVETVLRKSTFKRLFFNTPLFSLCLVGAKLYYRMWSAWNAKKCFAPVLAHPLYGPQWRVAASPAPVATDSYASRSGRWLAIVVRLTQALAIALLVFGASLQLVRNYTTDVPTWDQWDGEAAYLYQPYLEGTLTVGQLIQPHNEHRILATRLIALALLNANGHWDPQLQMLINAVLRTVTSLVVFLSLAGLFRRSHGIPAAVLVVALYAFPFSWENATSGFHSQFYLPVIFGFALFLLFEASRRSALWLILALPLGLATLFTLASGVFAPAVQLMVTLYDRLRRRINSDQALAELIVAGTIVLVGVVLRVDVPGHAPLRAHSPTEFATALTKSLSWPTTPSTASAVAIHAPLLLLIGYALLVKAPRPRAKIVATVGVWVMLQMAAMAAMRGNGGMGPANRYLDSIFIGLVVGVASLALLGQLVPRRVRWIIAVLAIAWAGNVGSGLIATRAATRKDLAWLKGIQANQRINTAAYVRTGDIAHLLGKDFWDVPYPDPNRLAMLLSQPSLRAIYPTGIRQPLALTPETDLGPFERQARRDTRFCFGSFGDGQAAVTGSLRSAQLAASPFPNLWFPIEGTLPRPDLTLELIDPSTGQALERAHSVASPSGSQWLAPTPTVPFVVVLEDHTASAGAAVCEPSEMGELTRLGRKLMKEERRWLYAGGVLLLVAWLAAAADIWRRRYDRGALDVQPRP